MAWSKFISKGICISLFGLFPIIGCSAKNAPPGSAMLAQDKGRVTAVADHDGTVSIVDPKDDHTLYQGKVNKGDQITVDPAANEIRVGTSMMSHHLQSDHTYQILLKKS